MSEYVDQQPRQADAQNGAGPGQALRADAQGAHGGNDLGVLLGQLFDDLQ